MDPLQKVSMLTMAGDWKLLLLAGIGGAVISTTAAMAVARKVMKMSGEDRRKPEKWIKVGMVKEFRIYPVKSCQGISVEEATATKIGFQSEFFLPLGTSCSSSILPS